MQHLFDSLTTNTNTETYICLIDTIDIIYLGKKLSENNYENMSFSDNYQITINQNQFLKDLQNYNSLEIKNLKYSIQDSLKIIYDFLLNHREQSENSICLDINTFTDGCSGMLSDNNYLNNYGFSVIENMTSDENINHWNYIQNFDTFLFSELTVKIYINI